MRGRAVPSIFSSSIKVLAGLAMLLGAMPASAQYFDIYGDANQTLPAAQQAFDAMPDNAPDEERSALISDLIMGLIGKAKYKEAYELYLANAQLNLNEDARMGAMGHGLAAFTSDPEVQADYIAQLTAKVESESCAPCYARTFAAHHLARYFLLREDDLGKSIEWHKRALDISLEDLAPDDPARVNFAYQYAAYLRNQDLEASAAAVRYTEDLAFQLLPRDDHLGWLYVFLANALIALDSGRISEAADLFGRIADIGVKEWGPDDPQLLSIYQNAAVLLSRLGRSEQAVEVALSAEGNQAFSDAAELAYHKALIARLFFQDAKVDEAISYFEEALGVYEDTSDQSRYAASAWSTYANVLSIEGRHHEAFALSKKAMEVVAKFDETNPERREHQTTAAVIFARAGQTRRAADLLSPVLTFNEDALLDIYARDQDRRAIASDGNELFRDAMLVSLLNGEAERAWRSAQLAVISDLALSAAALSYPGDAEGFTEALDEVRLARTSVNGARASFAEGEGSSAQLAEAVRALEDAQEALKQGYPDFAEYLRPQPLSIAEAQALMSEGEAYILPMVFTDRVMTIALTSNGFAWGQSRTSVFEARELIGRVRNSIDASLGGTDAFDVDAAHALHELIFSEEVKSLVAGSDKLIFPAGGPLAVIPPSVLVSQKGSGQKPGFLIETHAIAITPSLGGRRLERPGAPQRFAGIGAPSLAQPPANRAALRGAVVDVKSIAALPSLPGATDELAALEAAFADEGTLVLFGDEATEEAVRAAPLADYQVLAFATHGLVSGQIDGLSEPALVLTPGEAVISADNDGLLTASEIARMSLAADWVVLSACNTAAGEGRASPTYSGLARAFQLAGARSLLLSHWPVRDDVATRLSIATVKASSSGVERSEALRQAQLALIQDEALAGAASPVVWAPFVIIE